MSTTMTTVQMSGDLLDLIAEEDYCQQTEMEELSPGEGGVRFCEGPLQRKRHGAKIKKWKQKWYKVEPGELSTWVI